MRKRNQFNLGVAVGMLSMVGADGAHWFITPNADAGTIRHLLVAVQVVACFAIAAWLSRYRTRAA